MLIGALCDYYDILAKAGKVLPAGYSTVKIHYVVSLTEAGEMDGIIDCQKKELVPAGKNKTKERKAPKEWVFPQRTEKPGIDSNIVEHRPLYIFGLNLAENGLTPDDRTDKARKSHSAFVEANLKFTEGMQSPLVQAYRRFLQNWKPEAETENAWLLGLGKDYGKSGFAFCLSGNPDRLLQDEPEIKSRWEQSVEQDDETEEHYISQCAVTGKQAPIARIHSKIKGVYGGLATGSVLIGFNNASENSYGHEQSYNSNISQDVMKRYTEALNYLLSSSRHKAMLDELTVVFWAMNPEENCEDLFMQMVFGTSDAMGAEQAEQMLQQLLKDARQGMITKDRLRSLEGIPTDVDFYMLGLKPNSSRLSVKFIIRQKYADVLWNIARFQQDVQIVGARPPVSLPRIKMELISPKSKNEKANPAVLSGLVEAMIHGSRYPSALLETMVRRVKTDSGNEKLNWVRAGVIKACINRNYEKEEMKVALDKGNVEPAYLCGRLFAVLERLQQEASNNSLNRTIKDAYFASASAKPALVFPKLIRLAQNHLNKVKYPSYYNRMIGEILNPMRGEFPENLLLKDQGKFIIGYYQQYQSFFEKKEKTQETEEMKDGAGEQV